MEGSRDGACLCEGFQSGSSGRASLLETPKDMLCKAQKCASACIRAPLLENVEGRSFLRAFLFRGIYVKFSREMQNSL